MTQATTQKTETVKIEKAKPFFTIETKEAKKAISLLKKVINHSAVLPVLECVLIIIDNFGVRFVATDLESYLGIAPKVFTYGGEIAVCVNENYLQWFINKSFEKEITIEFIGDKCKMICGQFHIVVETEYANNYPKQPEVEIKRGFEVDKQFMSKLSLASRFVTRDDLRPAMTGVYLDSENGKITIASTDAHRLYWHKTGVEVEGMFECILPAKGVRILLEAFKKGGLFEVDANRIRFTNEDCQLMIRKIDARFPDYRKVFPNPNMTISVKRKDLLNYLSLACHFANLSTHQVKVNLKKDHAELVTGNDFGEDVVNTIAISKTINEEYSFGVNALFLYDAVICSGEEYVEIKTESLPTKAMLVDGHVLLMPLMINQ